MFGCVLVMSVCVCEGVLWLCASGMLLGGEVAWALVGLVRM